MSSSLHLTPSFLHLYFSFLVLEIQFRHLPSMVGYFPEAGLFQPLSSQNPDHTRQASPPSHTPGAPLGTGRMPSSTCAPSSPLSVSLVYGDRVRGMLSTLGLLPAFPVSAKLPCSGLPALISYTVLGVLGPISPAYKPEF